MMMTSGAVATFLLGWSVDTGACLASYQIDIVLRCMMMTSGAVATFLLGWSVATGGWLASYQIDIVLRCMMMTSGAVVKYSGHGLRTGADVLRAVAEAGVLAGYDK
jgi:solute carrier family 25 (mitochondrial adenine nucleotide translocator), member 4/5/6/31